MFVNLTIFMVQLQVIKNFFYNHFSLKNSNNDPNVEKKIKKANSYQGLFAMCTALTLIITLSSWFIYKGSSVASISTFMGKFLLPIVFYILPLKIAYHFNKSIKVKALTAILVVFYILGFLKYLSDF